MLAIVKFVRRLLEGSVVSILLIAVVALAGRSETINMLLADRSVSSLVFLMMLAVVLADLVAKLIAIFGSTFPDLIPKVDDADRKRASLINRLRPGETVALLSGAYSARVILFVLIFVLLGGSYSATPVAVQNNLVGDFTASDAATAFLREGIAGSLGYFFFFVGPERLENITALITTERLASASIDGDVFLAGIRLYGLAFVLAILRTLVTPITYIRARLRAHGLAKT
ncbi:MAG: hypothetical protein KDA46_05030 [Parvularculaceae bacterium]|nr:hypothetical protein [Parvularculaceae bacterium]